MQRPSAALEEARHDGLSDEHNADRGHDVAGRDAVFLLSVIAKQLMRIADAAERMSGSAGIQQQPAETKREKQKEDPLRLYLTNEEDYQYILEWAKLCKSPKDIYNSIALPLKKKGYGMEITTTLGFIKALLPYLTNYTASLNAESICRALRK